MSKYSRVQKFSSGQDCVYACVCLCVLSFCYVCFLFALKIHHQLNRVFSFCLLGNIITIVIVTNLVNITVIFIIIIIAVVVIEKP